MQKVQALCDAKKCPVITAANEALKTGNVNLILIWVKPGDESEIKELFEKTIRLRKINPEVEQLADRNFLENLIRIHQSGEDCPCVVINGINENEPFVDINKALEQGKIDSLLQQINSLVNNKTKEYFQLVISKKGYNKNDIKAGREYVQSYMKFVQYLERIYKASKGECSEIYTMQHMMPP